jgi:hypothetical protein
MLDLKLRHLPCYKSAYPELSITCNCPVRYEFGNYEFPPHDFPRTYTIRPKDVTERNVLCIQAHYCIMYI